MVFAKKAALSFTEDPLGTCPPSSFSFSFSFSPPTILVRGGGATATVVFDFTAEEKEAEGLRGSAMLERTPLAETFTFTVGAY